MQEEIGKSRCVYIPKKLDDAVEKTREKLGWSRSYLFKYALTKLLQDLSVLTTTVHLPDLEEKEVAGK